MPEYDAFGRPVGEDPLREQGWGDSVGGSGAAGPVEPVATPVTARTAPAPAEPRRRRGGGCVAALVVLAIVGVVLGGALLAVVGQVSDTVDTVRDGIADFGVETRPSAPGIDGEDDATAGGDGPSLVATAGVTQAVRALRAVAPGRVRTLRLQADRADAQAIGGGRLRIAQFKRGAEAGRVVTAVKTSSMVPTVRWTALDPRAPARLIRAGARRLRTTPKRLDYVVASGGAGGAGVSWTAFYKGGRYASGDARGRLIRVYRP